MDFGFQDFLPQMLSAIFLGAVLGVERQKRGKTAGIRTYMIICLASCTITICGVIIGKVSERVDPQRLPSQILAGIGFLGAGVILRQGAITSGVTSAATIILDTGIGIACGLGEYTLAFVGAGLDLLALSIAARYFPNTHEGTSSESPPGAPIKFSCRTDKFAEIRSYLGYGWKLLAISRKDDILKLTISTNLSSAQREALLDKLVGSASVLTLETHHENN